MQQKELEQLHILKAFKSIDGLIKIIWKTKAMSSLTFFTEKWDDTIKACACANGIKPWVYMKKDDVAGPIVMLESIF